MEECAPLKELEESEKEISGVVRHAGGRLHDHKPAAASIVSTTVSQPMSRFGAERVALASAVASVLGSSRHRYFLDSGTLLGLWRDGALIENDDDFDLGVLVDESAFSNEWLADLHSTLDRGLHSTPYETRVVDTYAKKVEVFDPAHGAFVLEGDRYEGSDFHHVTVDVQPFVHSGLGVTIPHWNYSGCYIPAATFEPFGKITFANMEWPIPLNPMGFLTALYGYIGHGAVFDPISKLYRLDMDMSAPLTVYTDMCADLFHVGHVRYLEQCKKLGSDVHLIVGLHDDETIESYKRSPICTAAERAAVLESCIYVDEVVASAPLKITERHMSGHNIDIVVHGDGLPGTERHAMYSTPIEMGRYTEVLRMPGISTTGLIDRVAARLGVSYSDHALPSDRDPMGTELAKADDQLEFGAANLPFS